MMSLSEKASFSMILPIKKHDFPVRKALNEGVLKWGYPYIIHL